jgi:hypothetical protein
MLLEPIQYQYLLDYKLDVTTVEISKPFTLAVVAIKLPLNQFALTFALVNEASLTLMLLPVVSCVTSGKHKILLWIITNNTWN